ESKSIKSVLQFIIRISHAQLLFLMLVNVNVYATDTESVVSPPVQQTITVTGTVTEEGGQPLPGVNVIEKGTNNGTSTDASGRFSINVEGESSVLVFSFSGYASQEIPVGNKNDVSVNLVADVQALQEVVVV